MKILALKSNNIKRIRAVEMTLDPDKRLVMITGKNAQGKTSVLDSIWYALGGKKNIPDKPIRDGEEKGEIEINLDGFKIIRTFTAKDSYLKILTREGSAYADPQNFLNYVVGQLSFDPLEFSRMDSKKQVEGLIKITGLDFTEAEDLKKKMTEDRVIVGREEKAMPTRTPEYVEWATKLKDAVEISVAELSGKLTEESKKRNTYLATQHEITTTEADIEKDENQIKIIQQEIATRKRKIIELKKVEDTKENLESIQDNISRADETNKNVRASKSCLEDLKKKEDKHQEYIDLTNKIKAIDEEKAKKLSEAQMPIEGLTWDDNGVLFKGIPFNQLSAAEQLKVSMAIAMAANPKLKVILIRDGSLLDPDNLKVIEEMAKDKDFQIWIEKVDESGNIGVYIEDGEIKKVN